MTTDPAPAIFADGKEPDALRTIGEVSTALGIRQHVLRYWEDQFPMLRPLKRSGGRRYYRAEDVRLVQRIDQLVHHQGFTLRGARLAIEGKPAAAQAELSERFAALPPSAAPQSSEHRNFVPELIAVRDGLLAALAD